MLATFKLLQRHFKVADFQRLEARVTDDLAQLVFPVHYSTGQMIGVKVLSVVDGCIEEESLDGGGCGGVFPFLHCRDWTGAGQDALLVGSLLDSVVLAARTDTTVIVLPDWNKLSPDLLPFLHKFSTITIWLGGGVQGAETARSFARKLGDTRCRVVTNAQPGPVQAVRKQLEVGEILETAARQSHQYITTFDKLRHDVFLEFLQRDQMEGVKWTRFEGLNQLLRGFRRGEMTVITGRTGSGKTTFMSEYSLDLCSQGVTTLWGSFEVQNVRLARMMLKQFSLVDIDTEIQQFDRIAEEFSELPMYFTTFHGTQVWFINHITSRIVIKARRLFLLPRMLRRC